MGHVIGVLNRCKQVLGIVQYSLYYHQVSFGNQVFDHISSVMGFHMIGRRLYNAIDKYCEPLLSSGNDWKQFDGMIFQHMMLS